MSLLRLIRTESDLSARRLLVVATLTGLSTTLLLVIINIAAEQGSNDVSSTRTFVLFLLVLALYVVSQRQLLAMSTIEIEKILDRIRQRIARQIQRSELLELDRLGRAAIHATVSKDTVNISQAASTIVIGAQSAVLLLFTTLYLASLSKIAFVLCLAVSLLAYRLHQRRAAEASREIQESLARENDFMVSLDHMLDGFKEARLNHRRSADLLDTLRRISEDAARIKIRARDQFTSTYIVSQTSFYLVMATVVFVLPRILPTYSDVLTKLTAAVLFVIGPVSSLVASLPVIASANAAVDNLEAIEARLSQSAGASPDEPAAPELEGFERVDLQRVVFRYPEVGGETPFTVGPVDLTLHRGEVLFIVGGNGSGKSTLLKLMTALYPSSEGTVSLDGVPVRGHNRDSFRSLFSAIFWDYHLFDRLYGLRDADPAEVERLLAQMQIDTKVHLVDGRFDTLELSTGQKKRLALVVSLLENRPIQVFDEWAADQDPAFRRYFYEELLPQLKASGKTILAATHDDRYFHTADRVLHMVDGRITSSEGMIP